MLTSVTKILALLLFSVSFTAAQDSKSPATILGGVLSEKNCLTRLDLGELQIDGAFSIPKNHRWTISGNGKIRARDKQADILVQADGAMAFSSDAATKDKPRVRIYRGLSVKIETKGELLIEGVHMEGLSFSAAKDSRVHVSNSMLKRLSIADFFGNLVFENCLIDHFEVASCIDPPDTLVDHIKFKNCSFKGQGSSIPFAMLWTMEHCDIYCGLFELRQPGWAKVTDTPPSNYFSDAKYPALILTAFSRIEGLRMALAEHPFNGK